MAGMKETLTDREMDKFVEDTLLKTCVRVLLSADSILRPKGLNTRGKITEVELVDFEWRPLPPVAAEGRNFILIQNFSGEEMKVNYDNSDIGEPLPGTYLGKVLLNYGETYYDTTDQIPIYGRMKSGTHTVIVEELV